MFNLPVSLSSPLIKRAMVLGVQAHSRHLGEAGTMLVPCSLAVLAQTPKAGRLLRRRIMASRRVSTCSKIRLSQSLRN